MTSSFESSFESKFDDMIKRQVEQFNRQVEDASSFHKHMLKRLCAERIRQDFEEAHSPPVRIRTIRPGRPTAVVSSIFQQVGKGIARRILPTHRNPAHRANTQPDVIEGEFVVLSNEISTPSTDKTNKEENQP